MQIPINKKTATGIGKTIDYIVIIPIKNIETASHPWSKSYPRGEELPVRLAYLPSTASRFWYANIRKDPNISTHDGRGSVKLLLSSVNNPKVSKTDKKPIKVSKLGATHIGTYSTSHNQK